MSGQPQHDQIRILSVHAVPNVRFITRLFSQVTDKLHDFVLALSLMVVMVMMIITTTTTDNDSGNVNQIYNCVFSLSVELVLDIRNYRRVCTGFLPWYIVAAEDNLQIPP